MYYEAIIRRRANSYPIHIDRDLVEIAKNNYCAGIILGILLSWTTTKKKQAEQARIHNAKLRKAGRTPNQLTDLWIWMSNEDMQAELLKLEPTEDRPGRKPLFSRETISAGFSLLESEGLIKKRHNPFNKLDHAYQYLIILDEIQKRIDQLPLIKSPSGNGEDDFAGDSPSDGSKPIIEKSTNGQKSITGKSTIGESAESAHPQAPEKSSKAASEADAEDQQQQKNQNSAPLPEFQQSIDAGQAMNPYESSPKNLSLESSGEEKESNKEKIAPVALIPPSFSPEELACFALLQSREQLPMYPGSPARPDPGAKWDRENMLVWIQYLHGEAYTAPLLKKERTVTGKLFEMRFHGKPINRQQFLQAYVDIMAWWTNYKGRLLLEDLFKDERILDALAKRFQAEQKAKGAAGQQEQNKGASGPLATNKGQWSRQPLSSFDDPTYRDRLHEENKKWLKPGEKSLEERTREALEAAGGSIDWMAEARKILAAQGQKGE